MMTKTERTSRIPSAIDRLRDELASQYFVGYRSLREGLRLIALGIAIGGGLSLLLTRVLITILGGLSPADPLAFGGASSLVLLIGVAAIWIPARSATRVDPTVALRAD